MCIRCGTGIELAGGDGRVLDSLATEEAVFVGQLLELLGEGVVGPAWDPCAGPDPDGDWSGRGLLIQEAVGSGRVRGVEVFFEAGGSGLAPVVLGPGTGALAPGRLQAWWDGAVPSGRVVGMGGRPRRLDVLWCCRLLLLGATLATIGGCRWEPAPCTWG